MHANDLPGLLPEHLARQLVDDLAPRDAYNCEQVARRLSVSVRFVHQLIDGGELRGIRVGRRLLVSRRALDDFVELRDRMEDGAA